MGRPVPTTDVEQCDGCGATPDEVVIYDFMGDYLCHECADDGNDTHHEACCDNEKRSFEGGCVNCGDPSL